MLTLYNTYSWANTTDFTSRGSGTATLNGSAIDLGGSAILTDYVYVNTISTHVLPHWQIQEDVKIVTIASGDIVGNGVSSEITAAPNFLQGDIATNTGTSPAITFRNNAGTIGSAGTGPNFSAGDVLRLITTFTDTVATFTVTNLTTSTTSTPITLTFVAGSTPLLPTYAKFGLFDKGTSGHHQLVGLKINTTTIQNANLMVFGNSISQAYYASSFNGNWVNQAAANYPSVVEFAGSGGGGVDVRSSMDVILLMRPKQVIFAGTAANDIINGKTVPQAFATEDSLTQILQAAGITVWHGMFPEDSTAGGTGLKSIDNVLRAAYPTRYIDWWDDMSTSNKLKAAYAHGDGVHPNQAGHNQIYATLLACNCILNTRDRAAQIRTDDQVVRLTGDSLNLSQPKLKTLIQQIGPYSSPLNSLSFGPGTVDINLANHNKFTGSQTFSSIGVGASYTNPYNYNDTITTPSSGISSQIGGWFFENITTGNGILTYNLKWNGGGHNYLFSSFGNAIQANAGSIIMYSAASGTAGTSATVNGILAVTTTGLGVGSVGSAPKGWVHVPASSTTTAGMVFTTGGGLQSSKTDGSVNYVSNNLNLTVGTTDNILFKGFSGSATLDFPSTGAGAVSDLTIAVTGAAVGDPVILGVPNGSVTTTAVFTAWVSSSNTVTVRFSPKATEDPASGTFNVNVLKQ
jgi:hypothetical protein